MLFWSEQRSNLKPVHTHTHTHTQTEPQPVLDPVSRLHCCCLGAAASLASFSSRFSRDSFRSAARQQRRTWSRHHCVVRLPNAADQRRGRYQTLQEEAAILESQSPSWGGHYGGDWKEVNGHTCPAGPSSAAAIRWAGGPTRYQTAVKDD